MVFLLHHILTIKKQNTFGNHSMGSVNLQFLFYKSCRNKPTISRDESIIPWYRNGDIMGFGQTRKIKLKNQSQATMVTFWGLLLLFRVTKV